MGRRPDRVLDAHGEKAREKLQKELREGLDLLYRAKEDQRLSWQETALKYLTEKNGQQLLSVARLRSFMDRPLDVAEAHGATQSAILRARKILLTEREKNSPRFRLYKSLCDGIARSSRPNSRFDFYLGKFKLLQQYYGNDRIFESEIEFFRDPITRMECFVHTTGSGKKGASHQGPVIYMPNRLLLVGMSPDYLSLKIIQREAEPKTKALRGVMLNEPKVKADRLPAFSTFVLYSADYAGTRNAQAELQHFRTSLASFHDQLTLEGLAHGS